VIAIDTSIQKTKSAAIENFYFLKQLPEKILLLLIVAFIVQIITAFNCFNYNSDEYFEIIEYASYKLGITPRSFLTWEFAAQIRPSVQVYMFEYLYRLLSWMGLPDRFLAISVLHVLTAIFGFTVCNYLVIKKFRNEPWLFHVLLLTNFLGILPFLRASFSAETVGGLTLIASLLILEKALQIKSSLWWAFLTGIITGFAFFFRFQVAFAYTGVAVWLLVFHRHERKKLILLFAGFIVAAAVNTVMDHSFYGNWCCTPFNYFVSNIVQGKAASFGVQPWWYYVAILAILPIPLLSLLLMYLLLKGFLNFRNVYSVAMLFFITGYSVIDHKEERFIFPVLFLMGYLCAESYRNSITFQTWFKKAWANRSWGVLLKAGIWFSIILNLFLLVLLTIEPYKQPMKFIEKINENDAAINDTVYSFKQSPYTTESGLEYRFLSQNKLTFRILSTKADFLKAVKSNPGNPVYYSIKYDDAMNNGLEEFVHRNDGIVSSGWLWIITNWMGKNFQIYIPDMWLLQQYKE
jgi:phosphatidylinositol glycan class B